MKKLRLPFLSLFVTATLILIYFLFMGYAPWGAKTLCHYDAYKQYVELFAYFKDVLSHHARIASTFSKGIGGEGIGVYSYYLASPLSLLVVFFNKSQLPAFYNILVIIKLSLASATMSFFLQERFPLKRFLVILLGMCYGLCQYGLAQSINIMWLDGMYMMPLMMLGVYYVIDQKKIKLLSISMGLAIIFNWYSGAICSLMTIIVAAVELLFKYLDDRTVLSLFKSLGRIILAMICGLMMSCILFIPTILAMQTNSRSNFDLSLLAPGFRDSLVTLISSYHIGAQSTKMYVSLYMGSLPIAGTIAILYAKHINVKEKVLCYIFLLIVLLCFYFQPFYMVFSLFVNPGSFWCRFSYIGTFTLAYLSAFYFSRRKSDDYALSLGMSVFIIALIVLSYVNHKSFSRIILSACLMMAMVLVYDLMHQKRLQMMALSLLCVSELTMNMHDLFTVMKNEEVHRFAYYVKQGIKQVNALKKNDSSIYRISQTDGMLMKPSETTPYYNDGYLFHTSTITSYVSAQSSTTLHMLDHLGYRNFGDRMTIVNTSILPTDSLLGVKYILSRYPIQGLEKTNIPAYNGRQVYRNPYVLPLAFTYKNTSTVFHHRNLFAYTNALYSELCGIKLTLYKNCAYTKKQMPHQTIYSIKKPANTVLYGNIYTSQSLNGYLDLNGFKQGYSRFLGPSVFYIPGQKVTFTHQKAGAISEDFYALDLKVLKKAQAILRKRAAKIKKWQDGYVKLKVSSKQKSSLFLSIPADENWEVHVDGKKVSIQKVDECFMSIPLSKGFHTIVLKAHIRGLKAGMIASFLGAIFILLYDFFRREHHL